MTVKECYEAIDGNYEEVISRLRSDDRVKKFVLKFLDDGSYQLLCDALNEKNYDEAFRAAHTIKGICQNLGFNKLYESSASLTEKLRNKEIEDIDKYVEIVQKDYETTIKGIRELS